MAPLWRNAPPIHPVSALTGDGIVALADAVLAPAKTSPQSARRAKHATESTHRSLADSFQNLRHELDLRLAFNPAAGVSMQLLNAEHDSPASSVEVLLSVRPEGNLFQLGVVAGALIVLASEMNLSCSVEDLDMAGGRMQLLLERVD